MPRSASLLLLAIAAAIGLAATAVRAQVAALPPAQDIPPAEALAGRWGMAAYFRPEDQGRAVQRARGACTNPFVIEPTGRGTVLMHTIDGPNRRETRFGTRAGRVVLGVVDQPDERYDRTVVFNGADQFEWTWAAPEIANRLGINLFVRCR